MRQHRSAACAYALEHRHHAQHRKACRLLDLGRRPEAAIQLLDRDRARHAEQAADRKGDHQGGLILRQGRRKGRPGIGQHARIRPLDILLLAQFLEAIEETFVDGPVGLRLAFQLLELRLVLAGLTRDRRCPIDLDLELLLLRLRRVQLGLNGDGDAAGFGGEAAADSAQFVARLDQSRMIVAELLRKLRDPAAQLDFLHAQARPMSDWS